MIEKTLESLDLRQWVRPGDTVLWSPSVAEPVPLVARLLEQRAELGGIRVILSTSYSGMITAEHTDHIRFLSTVGQKALDGQTGFDILPVHASQIPGMIASGQLRIDVVLAQLAQGPAGSQDLSFAAGDLWVSDAMRKARMVIAEINAQAPYTCNGAQPGRIDVCIRTDRPMLSAPERAYDAADLRIASHIAGLVPDGATLQVGVGGVVSALTEALSGHRNLGIHSGGIGDMVAELTERGVITNACKTHDRGISVGATLLGTDRLFRFAHGNPGLRIDSSSYVHNPRILAGLPGLVSINSALEVDLTGSLNSEVAGQRYVGSVGGQVDFIAGANASKGGLSIVALRAGGKGGSRIIPAARGVTTTSKADIGLVVTEHGIADLRGQSLSERARRLIAIAPEDARAALERSAFGHGD